MKNATDYFVVTWFLGTNAYRYANIVRHIPKPNRVICYFVVTWFLSPVTSIYIWNYYLCVHSHVQELPAELTKLQDLIFFLCLQLVWMQIFAKNDMDIWPLLTLTCGYILVVFLHKNSGSSRRMAYGQLLLNSVLCFLVNKFGKVDVKSLKTALFDSSE